METWSLRFDEWVQKEEPLREALCTLGNGYFATRGAGEEAQAGAFHYPGTYLAGGYNRLKTMIKEQEIENEDLVNWPNWTCLTFRHEDGDWFDLGKVEIISFEQILDFKSAELVRKVHFKNQSGKESRLEGRRFVSMDNQHIGAIKWKLTPLNWSGHIEVKSYLDGSVTNSGVERYKDLNHQHLEIKSKVRLDKNAIMLETITNESELVMAQAARTSTGPALEGPTYWEGEKEVGVSFKFEAQVYNEIQIEKIVCLYTSKDKAIFNPAYEAGRMIKDCPSYDVLLCDHKEQWKRLWDLCDIQLCSNPHETKLLRLHIFHLLQTVSFKSIDLDVGVPSRGLHGEAYRGHIFWDEIFIFPFLNLRIPEITRSLLMYRYRRLPEARLAALAEGHEGAMFPWQSGSNGEEESQVMHLNPRSGRWLPDNTYKQRHINATIVYNVWKYYQVTHDREFLFFFGIEMLLEISRYWVSLMTFNEARGRYDINGVVGPDEFHTKYPDRKELGIDNNAYTNFMASWSIRCTLRLFHTLPHERRRELLNILHLTKQDLLRWEEVSKKVYIPLREDGIIDQFEGFEDLLDLDWEQYRKQYGNIQRIDRILEVEGDSCDRYKVNKQADVLMLFYLFSKEELSDGFIWLNYSFDPSIISKNIEYHIALSSNGSSLSRIVHSWVLSKYDYSGAWVWFQRALEHDIADIQGGTTAEGIHLGAMAGTVDLVQRCFTGLEVKDDILQVNPSIPEEINHFKLSIRFRGQTLRLRLEDGTFSVKVHRSSIPAVSVSSGGEIYRLRQGEGFSFPIKFGSKVGLLEQEKHSPPA